MTDHAQLQLIADDLADIVRAAAKVIGELTVLESRLVAALKSLQPASPPVLAEAAAAEASRATRGDGDDAPPDADQVAARAAGTETRAGPADSEPPRGGKSISAARVLAALKLHDAHGGTSGSYLAAELQASQPTVSQRLRELEQRGLVQRLSTGPRTRFRTTGSLVVAPAAEAPTRPAGRVDPEIVFGVLRKLCRAEGSGRVGQIARLIGSDDLAAVSQALNDLLRRNRVQKDESAGGVVWRIPGAAPRDTAQRPVVQPRVAMKPERGR